jgi:hypothetical protein
MIPSGKAHNEMILAEETRDLGSIIDDAGKRLGRARRFPEGQRTSGPWSGKGVQPTPVEPGRDLRRGSG